MACNLRYLCKKFCKRFIMSKKIFLLFFTLFTFSLKVPAYDFENAGIYYTVSSRQKYTVAVTSSPQQRSAYRGEIVVPPSVVYEGKTFRVTEISKRAFQGCAQLVSLTVPASVVEIGVMVFRPDRQFSMIARWKRFIWDGSYSMKVVSFMGILRFIRKKNCRWSLSVTACVHWKTGLFTAVNRWNR